ncbi:MAG: STAS domain-containing protein [Thermoguttaceae bacterium]
MSQSRIETKKVGEVTVAVCRDMKLNDDLVIQEWGDQLLALLEAGSCPCLLINFERVLFMSSSALRMLITLNKKVKDTNTLLILSNIDDNIMEAFRITRLDTVFQIKKTEDEAVRALALLGDIPPNAR